MIQKVMVFGIDGVRFDRLRAAATPHLDALGAGGFLVPARVADVNPTVSGPCWTSIVTGVDADRHGVLSNDLRGSRITDHPCFLSRAARAGFATYAAGGWLPLLTSSSGGPILRPQMQFVPPRPAEATDAGDAASDHRVAEHAAATLASGDTDIAFVYFGQVDDVGHHLGTGQAYRQAIETVDAEVGLVLSAIESRPQRRHESWTIIATTDHGHRDSGGHGGDSDVERTAWIAASGPGVDAIATEGLAPRDVASLALRPFGLS